ncbi:MAG: acyl-CoA dehydrogenase family protein [Immundisolibacteraceae bacterium]|nr:acyl-CoA dehydrogenase family protein [Immundisolibacteraceae bacterium]
MDYQLNELQQMLQQSAEKYIERDYDFLTRQSRAASDLGYSQQQWQQFAELGWLGLPFNEEDGGFGGGAGEIMVLMEAFGRGLVLEPYLASIVLSGQLFARLGNTEQKADLLPKLIDGSCKLALAHSEPGSRYELERVQSKADSNDASYLLSGQKSVVLNGNDADYYLISARTGGAGDIDAEGISLFLVAADSPGLTVRGYRTADGLQAADLTFEQLEVAESALLGEPGNAFEAIEWCFDQGIAALSAEALGCMEILHQTTVEYLQTRKQFDTPIGKFQVLQHAAVDMFIALSQSRSMVYLAADRADSARDQRRAALSAAKNFIGRAGRLMGQSATQLHGGVGMSDELNVSHYFKRLTTINTWLGDDNHHLAQYSDSLL